MRIQHRGGKAIDIAALPGDVDGDGITSPHDLLTLIDGLSGVVDPSLTQWQCDIDRSDVCAPADLLRLIDVLNGAGDLDVWLGAGVPDCSQTHPQN